MTTRWCASRAAFAKITCLAGISTSSWSRGASPESLAEACRWWIRLEPALAQPRLTAALGRVIATLGGGRHCSRQCTLASCSACRTRMRKLWSMGGFSGGWPKRGRWPGRWRVTPPRADPARLRGLVDAAISPTSAAWSLRLSVRTSGFQPGKRGSTPLGTASGFASNCIACFFLTIVAPGRLGATGRPKTAPIASSARPAR